MVDSSPGTWSSEDVTVHPAPPVYLSMEGRSWASPRSPLGPATEHRRDDDAGLGIKGHAGSCAERCQRHASTHVSIEPSEGQTFPCRITSQGLSPDAAMPGLEGAPRPTGTYTVSRAGYTCRRCVVLTDTPDSQGIPLDRPTDVLTSLVQSQFRPPSQMR